MSQSISYSSLSDVKDILALYNKVAEIPGGLARLQSEINDEYIESFIKRSLDRGICLIARNELGELVGEIHVYAPNLYCFSHVFLELTIAVHPGGQGKGLGRKLFSRLINEVKEQYPDILRIELVARESNKRAINFYESLGFQVEGKFYARIKNVDGTFESDIPMALTLQS